MRFIRLGSWLVVGVLLLVIISATGKLIAASPAVLEGGIAHAQLDIAPAEILILPGRTFTCTLDDRLDQCTATVEGQILTISMHYPSRERVGFASDVTCQASYGDRPFECEAFYDFGPGALPIANFSSDLGLTTTQVTDLQRAYPLDQAGEMGWFRVVQKVVTASAILSCLIAWFNTRYRLDAITGLSVGVATTSLSYGAFLVMLPQVSSWLRALGSSPLPLALTVGIGTGVTVLLGWLLGRKTYQQANRVIASLAGGIGLSLVLSGSSVVLGILLSITVNPAAIAAYALAAGLVGATLMWWRPLLIGRAIASIKLGLLVYCILAYSFLLLLLTIGLVD